MIMFSIKRELYINTVLVHIQGMKVCLKKSNQFIIYMNK